MGLRQGLSLATQGAGGQAECVCFCFCSSQAQFSHPQNRRAPLPWQAHRPHPGLPACSAPQPSPAAVGALLALPGWGGGALGRLPLDPAQGCHSSPHAERLTLPAAPGPPALGADLHAQQWGFPGPQPLALLPSCF